MAITPTYPGVYIEEIPSGVRTITGVATSITAFIGRAARGPLNEPITINSYGDFERIFGGLSLESTMSYAVRDFYMNGGSQAIIVRLFHTATTEEAQTAAEAVVQAAEAAAAEEGATADTVAAAAQAAVADAVAASVNISLARALLSVGGLNLEAANEGAWGNRLRARIDLDTDAPLFNLSIQDGGTGQIETIRNVSVESDHPRRVDRVLEQESQLVRVRGAFPTSRPEASRLQRLMGLSRLAKTPLPWKLPPVWLPMEPPSTVPT